MMYTNLNESCTEILDILHNIDKRLFKKVPKKIISFLEENKSKTYIPNIDYSKKIKDWEIGKKTKVMLGILYMNYWGTPNQRREYIRVLNRNEKKYQEEIKRKYKRDDLIKTKNKKI